MKTSASYGPFARKFSLFIALLALSGVCFATPFASYIVDFNGPFGNGVYGDPNAVLGAPSTEFYDCWASWSGGSADRIPSLVEPPFNTDLSGNPLITTLNNDAWITVGFDNPIMNDPLNLYGIDFLVFGNAFYTGDGWVNEHTNMNEYMLTGGVFSEPVTVSVSQDGDIWHTYETGPFGDSAFPTQPYLWDAENACWSDQMSDFTRPVDPGLEDLLAMGGITAAEAIGLYQGSGGGTGFDLDVFGLDWIQYIRVSGNGGEIDAFADVSPVVPEPATCALIGIGLSGLSLIRRRKEIA